MNSLGAAKQAGWGWGGVGRGDRGLMPLLFLEKTVQKFIVYQTNICFQKKECFITFL